MHGEFSQFSFYETILTGHELKKYFDISKMPYVKCDKNAFIRYVLDEKHTISESLSGIVWKPYGMSAI